MKKLMIYFKKYLLKMALLISRLIGKISRQPGYCASDDVLFI